MPALSAARVVAAVGDAAERWCDADFPARVRATRAVMERTGYAEPVVDFALDALFERTTRAALSAAIEGELGSLAALDGFVERPGRPDVHYRGVARATIVSSDTTIGVAIPSLCYALCANVGEIVVKDRNDGLVAAFADTLVEERPEFAARLRVERWNGHDDPGALTALAKSDVVVAFGGNEALAAIRALLRPDARFVPFGHRTSIAYVSRETLADANRAHEAAAGIARDALLYDGDGCLSLHTVFVEGSELRKRGETLERGEVSESEAFGVILGRALDTVAVEFPSSGAELAPATARFAASARFRAAQGSGSVRGGVSATHVLAFDAPPDMAPPLLPRALAAYIVSGPPEAAAFLRGHTLPLEGFALDPRALAGAERPDLIALALDAGAVRLAPFGALQTPEISGEHGGASRILPFVRAIVRG